ncbi:Two pore potassium channel [Seminavis robusta]|uniref:Two pore potassium channel n=1 Tax=Seminavis robusta TaxID=568900 RepID=A0A9N8DRY2_9STRA|nr:Two pore potassium channel [Seminavis robusta]|eukprot:Sro326_g118110.1 Two pore potassium channel (518) ;mRNA; f:35727-37374
MPPASFEYRDVELGQHGSPSSVPSSNNQDLQIQQQQQQQRVRFQPPPSIIHPAGSSAECSSSIDTPTSASDRRKGKWKSIKKVFRKNRHHHKGTPAEQEGILKHDDIRTAGTFDTATVTAASACSEDPYQLVPPSLNVGPPNQKWGTEREAIQRNLPDLWAKEANAGRKTDIRKVLVKQAQDSIRNLMEFSLWQCLLAILLYVAFSVGCFSFWLEDWTMIDSTYFAIVTFTTIGYGDVVPDTKMSRMFTCFWALSGVACLGIALGVLGSNIIEVSTKEEKKIKQKHGDNVISMFEGQEPPVLGSRREDTSSLGSFGAEDYLQQSDDDDDDSVEEQCCSIPPKFIRLFFLYIFLGLLLVGISETEDWTWSSTLYYGLITASTVGYGDLSPATEMGRVLAIVYIPVAVCVMGFLLDIVANSIISSRRRKAQQYLKSKELTLKDLEVMDNDGDGSVTRAEFLEFMLVSMNQVDQEQLDNLNEHFDRLDSDGSGALDKYDLLTKARKKLASERSLRLRYVN